MRRPQGCESRRGADNSKTTPAVAAVHKATNSKSNPEEESVPARVAEFEALTEFHQQLLQPYLRYFPSTVKLATAAEFVLHRAALRRPLSISAAKQLLDVLEKLSATGVDLNESLNRTVLAGLAVPFDPRSKPNTRGPPQRPRANDDFSQAEHIGTDDSDLPAHLRPN
jgi:hypothetical protein